MYLRTGRSIKNDRIAERVRGDRGEYAVDVCWCQIERREFYES